MRFSKVGATRKMVFAGLGVFATALLLALWVGARHQVHQRLALVDRLTRTTDSDAITQIASPELLERASSRRTLAVRPRE